MEQPPGLPIAQADWEQTPQAVQGVVITLWQMIGQLQQQLTVQKDQIAQQQEQIIQQQEQIARLEGEVAKLREQVNRNSHNSSQPPSSDGPRTPPRPKSEPSGRKAGGQKGHPGHGRQLKSSHQVQRLVVCKPDTCQQCGALLLGEDPQPQRHQVSEIPKPEPVVTEYQLHTLTCLACGAQTSSAWPQDMPTGSFGPRTQAMVAYLGGRFGLSHRDIVELMEVGFHLDLSLGSVPAQEQAMSQALQAPVEAAQAYVQQQPSANVDETGWHEMGQQAWLWVGTARLVTTFRLLATRSAEGVKRLLGESFTGILGSDRWTAYTSFDPSHRQVCWAHLKRDFQALQERGGESWVVGKLLLQQTALLFSYWHRVRDGTLSRADFATLVQPVRNDVKTLLEIGTLTNQASTRKTCANILKLEQALWTFVYQEGIEPTNNAAERPLRRGVLWRKRCFGTQSQPGSLFVERILTTVMTLRQQNRDVLEFLTQARLAEIGAAHVPSLLPTN
jgi:transposase